MSLLDEKARRDLSIRLLRRRARISIAHQETGLSRNRLRALYRELHGRGASCGQLPAIGGATIQTGAQQVHARLFAALYGRYAGAGLRRQLAIRAVIAAYDLYRLMALPQVLLDFNGAWVIARDLRVGTSEMRHCAACELHYLLGSAGWRRPAPSVSCMRARVGALSRVWFCREHTTGLRRTRSTDHLPQRVNGSHSARPPAIATALPLVAPMGASYATIGGGRDRSAVGWASTPFQPATLGAC